VRESDRSIDCIIAVIEDISALKQAEEELREGEEQFRTLLLASPLPIALYDDREQVLAISESWLEETGYSREELRRLEDWTTRAYQERSDEVLKYLRGIISGEPQGKLSYERRIRTKDGRKRLWRFFALPWEPSRTAAACLFPWRPTLAIRVKPTRTRFSFCCASPTTAPRTCSVWCRPSPARTAARQPEDFIERFNERIRALASSHDLLVRNEWQGAYVEDLVRSQLAHFADLVGSRIVVEGPKLRLNAAGAQAIGLALYELATNAGKYGALSVDTGRVDVLWGLEGDPFMMSWTERNGPPVSPPKRPGFGSTVVDSMMKQSVSGEVALNYTPSGLIWRLTCPAASALDRR
jgi:PAS domain S-box-containing protein